MKYKQMLKIRKTEKDPQVRDRILLNVLVRRDGMSVTGPRAFWAWPRHGESSGTTGT